MDIKEWFSIANPLNGHTLRPDSILGPLLFLVYINDLPEGLTTSAKLFADDTSLFSVVHDSAASAAFLNDDLLKISRWTYQWKIFNPDASKQA